MGEPPFEGAGSRGIALRGPFFFDAAGRLRRGGDAEGGEQPDLRDFFFDAAGTSTPRRPGC